MDGRELELFVARIEKSLLPAGFSVETPRREYGPDGTQIAEFDVVINGRLGSASVSWLIECRDRPSEGPAPGSWIEQLVGRRNRFGFDKVTAVSTTGFAAGASDFAQSVGIDLRSVEILGPDSMLEWLAAQQLNLIQRHIELSRFKVLVAETESPERLRAAAEVIRGRAGEDPVLVNPKTSARVSPVESFTVALSRRPDLWPETPAHGFSRHVDFVATYPIDDRYELETAEGMVGVPQIEFSGTLSATVQAVPFSAFVSYGDAISDERVVSRAVAEVTIEGRKYAIALENVTVDGTSRIQVVAHEVV